MCLGLESASGTQAVLSTRRTDWENGECKREKRLAVTWRPAIDTMTSTSPATNETIAPAALTITVPFTDKKGASNPRSFLCSQTRSSSRPSFSLPSNLRSCIFQLSLFSLRHHPLSFSASASFFLQDVSQTNSSLNF